MTINKSYLLTFYSLIMLFFFNYSSPFIFWVMTELNLLIFVVMLLSFNSNSYKQEMFDLTMFYFFVQSLASIFLLSDFFFSMDLFIFNCDVMFLISMLLKLGIFPFFYWVFKISEFLSIQTLWFLLTFQKIPFFSFLFMSCNNTYIPFILFFSFVSGAFLIFFSGSFVNMMVCSSILSSFWLFYLNLISFFLFATFFLIYSGFFYFILTLYSQHASSLGSSIFSLSLFMFLLGLSPMSLFFFKLELSNYFYHSMNSIEFFFFWALSFFSLFGYMKFSFKNFFLIEDFYFYTFSYEKKKVFFFACLVFFYVYLAYQGKLFKLSSSYLG